MKLQDDTQIKFIWHQQTQESRTALLGSNLLRLPRSLTSPGELSDFRQSGSLALRVIRGSSLPAVPFPADVNKNPTALLPEAHGLLASPYVLNPNPGFPFQILCPGLGPHPASGPGSVFTQLSLLRFSRPNFLFRFCSPRKQKVGCLFPLSRGAYN